MVQARNWRKYQCVQLCSLILLFSLLQDIYCKYKVYLEDKYTQTKGIPNTPNPDYNHDRVISLKGTTEVRAFILKS